MRPSLRCLSGSTLRYGWSAQTRAHRPTRCRRGTTARPSRRSSISSAPPPRAAPTSCRPRTGIATFDQDGTLWVEHPIYSQVVFALDRLAALAPEHPEWKDEGAVQDGALRRPRGHGEAHRAGPRGDRRRHPLPA